MSVAATESAAGSAAVLVATMGIAGSAAMVVVWVVSGDTAGDGREWWHGVGWRFPSSISLMISASWISRDPMVQQIDIFACS